MSWPEREGDSASGRRVDGIGIRGSGESKAAAPLPFLGAGGARGTGRLANEDLRLLSAGHCVARWIVWPVTAGSPVAAAVLVMVTCQFAGCAPIKPASCGDAERAPRRQQHAP
jgi:hypothetical protein